MTINKLEKEIEQIYSEMVQKEPIADEISNNVHPQYRISSKNLYRYLLLRSYDLRKIHDSLSDLGISSLRTSEAYVFKNIANVLRLIKLLQNKTWEDNLLIETIGYKQSKRLLRRHANKLFNETNKKHETEIMVTLANEDADNVDLMRNLVLEGMEIARINLSHGDIRHWQKMVENIHRVRKELGMPVKIYMDLSGPKIRTQDIEISDQAKGTTKNFIRLKEGEHLVLTKKSTKGKASTFGNNNELIQPAEVGVLLPQIIDDIGINDTVYFDDGMLKATVIAKSEDQAKLIINKAYKSKLAGKKGINLPDTHLNLPSLTEQDIELLPFVCQHADIVGYSFVRTADDVKKLYEELDKLKATDLGVVFKIENKEAFENLPLILFEAMKRPKIGVMIARGDLAVEIGFERISEVQNQILWLCEAAHVPVIWATQVLDNLAKTGVATRAEVSDAAISAQAECVMLNKGPYIVDAVRMLRDIIGKMEAHSSKKKSTLRALKIATSVLKKIDG